MGIELRLLQQVIDEYGRGGFTFGAQASMRQEDAEMMDAQQQQPGEQHQADARWQVLPLVLQFPCIWGLLRDTGICTLVSRRKLHLVDVLAGIHIPSKQTDDTHMLCAYCWRAVIMCRCMRGAGLGSSSL